MKCVATSIHITVRCTAISSSNTLIIQDGWSSKNGTGVYGRENRSDGTYKEYLDLDVNDLYGKYEDGSAKTAETVLAHEITHFLDDDPSVKIPYDIVEEENFETGDTYDATITFSSSEIKAVNAGNQIRATYGRKLRSSYAGITVLNKEVSNQTGKFSINGKTSYNKYSLLKDSQKQFDTGIYEGKFVDARARSAYWKTVKTSYVKPVNYKNNRTYYKDDTKGTNTKAIKFE